MLSPLISYFLSLLLVSISYVKHLQVIPILVEYLFIPPISSYLIRIIVGFSPNLSGELLLSIHTFSQQQNPRIRELLNLLQSQLLVYSTKNLLCFLSCFLLCPSSGYYHQTWYLKSISVSRKGVGIVSLLKLTWNNVNNFTSNVWHYYNKYWGEKSEMK